MHQQLTIQTSHRMCDSKRTSQAHTRKATLCEGDKGRSGKREQITSQRQQGGTKPTGLAGNVADMSATCRHAKRGPDIPNLFFWRFPPKARQPLMSCPLSPVSLSRSHVHTSGTKPAICLLGFLVILNALAKNIIPLIRQKSFLEKTKKGRMSP